MLPDHLIRVVDEIARSVAAGEFWWEVGIVTARGCHRVSMTFAAPPLVVRTFLLAYTATYQASVSLGEAFNRAIVDVLHDKVMAACAGMAEPATVELSLAGEQAKVWVSDAEIERDASTATTIEIKGAWINDLTGEIWINPGKISRGKILSRDGWV